MIELVFLFAALTARSEPAEPPTDQSSRPACPAPAGTGPGTYAAVDDICIYYEIHGKGEPVLLLHGGSTSGATFDPQIPALAQHYRVIVPDLRAHGRTTDGDGPLSYRVLAEDMLALLDRLGVEKTAVVGWSMGGAVSLHMALARPERLGCMALIATPYHRDGLVPAFRQRMATVAPEDWNAEVFDFYRTHAPDPSHWAVAFEKLRAMVLSEPQLTDDTLRTIATPALVLLGASDAVISPEHMRRMAELLPAGEGVAIPHGSHFIHQQNVETVNEALLGFLRSTCRDSALEGS